MGHQTGGQERGTDKVTRHGVRDRGREDTGKESQGVQEPRMGCRRPLQATLGERRGPWTGWLAGAGVPPL